MTRYAEFSNPPVVERVLSVGFPPLERFTAARMGEFWLHVRSQFPSTAEAMPYEMPVERLGDLPPVPGVEFRVGAPPSKTRLWLISEDDQRLIQIQRDWFAYNWRKRGAPYVHYEEGRESFVRYFDELQRFVEERELGHIDARQCEVTYINHIRRSGGASDNLSDVLRFIEAPTLSDPAVSVDNQAINMVLSLGTKDRAFGRLHLSVSASFVGGVPTWVANLTARGAPLGPGLDGVLAFLDEGRKAIVTNFVTLTTDVMHEEWGLQ